MQKWQEKKRQKVHESIIENAKSSFRRYSNSREKPTNMSRARPVLPQKQQVPINKILEIFQLQQYAHLLAMHKFVNTLASLEEGNLQLSEILLQVEEKDRERFSSLLHTLIIMSKNMNSNEKSSKIKQGSKNSISYPPQPTSTQSNKTPSSIPKSVNSQSKFRIKTRNGANSNHQTPKRESNSKEGLLGHRNTKVQIEMLTEKTRKRRKSISHGTQLKRRAMDDSTLIHNFDVSSKQVQGQMANIHESSKIIKRLTQKLSSLQPKTEQISSPLSIDLQMKKIQQMYLSFDSATLTSNIMNIDLQQITHCLALEIMALIEKCEMEAIFKTNQGKIKSLLHQSFIIVREQQRDSRTQLDSLHESEEQIREELSKFQHTNEAIMENIETQMELQNESEHGGNYTSSQSQSENPQNVVIRLKDNEAGLASSIWGNNYIASVINDFSCFDGCRNEDWKEVRVDDVKNFIDLVMMGGKMEKQIPILAFVYINRLLQNAPGSKLTYKNWKNITLITLIEASKIWDDRSLENHSFSKVVKPYTTLEINRLEKYLLFFIDYKLNINQKEYSESYFCLRKHSGQPCHTVNLLKLDLKTIKRLQMTEQKEEKERIDKKEFLRKCMNKSF